MRRVNEDSGAEIELAYWLLEEIGMPASNSDRLVVADCIRLLAKKGGTVKTAADFILFQAQTAESDGTVLNIWWFKDRKYLPNVPDIASIWTPEQIAQRESQKAIEEASARQMWEGMSEDFKKQNPWEGKRG